MGDVETPVSSRWTIWTVLLAIFFGGCTYGAHLLAFWTVLGVHALSPYAEELYLKENMKLPVPTVYFLDFAIFCRSFWYLGALWFLVAHFPICVGLQFLPGRWSWLKGVWSNGFLLAAVLYLGFATISMGLPLIQLLKPLAE